MNLAHRLTNLGRIAALLLFLWSPCARAGVTLSPVVAFAVTNGAHPTADLILDHDGNFRGSSYSGGISNLGVLFTLTPAGVLTNLVFFNGANGANPYGPLFLSTNGCFYGTTEAGGTNGGFGTVYQLAPDGTLTSLFSFNNTNGSTPSCGLVQDAAGYLYGTTQYGGTNGGYGTVFRLSLAGQLTTLASLDGTNTGGSPWPRLGPVGDGSFLGTASSFGPKGLGTIYQVSDNGVSNVISFDGQGGAAPYAPLVRGADGNFYGTASAGGVSNVGIIFRLTPGGALTNLVSFRQTNGAAPFAPLLQGPDGNFYGTTQFGGANNFGTVFKVTPAGTLTSLCSLDYAMSGDVPLAGLAVGADNNLYGAARGGGLDFVGTIFSVSVPMPPLFQSCSRSGGTLQLTWTSVGGQSYQLHVLADLSQSNWSNLGGAVTALGGFTTTSDSVSPLISQRYYRVLLLP